MQFSRRKFMQSAAAVPGLALARKSVAQPSPQQAAQPAIGEPGHFNALASKPPVKPHSVDLDSNYSSQRLVGIIQSVTTLERSFSKVGTPATRGLIKS